MSQSKFYIGYLPKMPASIRKFLLPLLILLGIAAGVLAFVLVSNQKGYSNSVFEFGQYTTVEGILIKEPAPMLLLDHGPDSYNKQRGILLVGFGKFGANGAIYQMENDLGQPLDNAKVQLRGTLIYDDGLSLLELTEGKRSLLTEKPTFLKMPHSMATQHGTATLKGEIIDTKCYFGVMKPGDGKLHRSCAIRCISGGIPPAVQVMDQAGNTRYYLIQGPNGEAINEKVLDYVADPVQISGKVFRQNGWWFVRTEGKIGRLEN
jgi:hypothetical protein